MAPPPPLLWVPPLLPWVPPLQLHPLWVLSVLQLAHQLPEMPLEPSPVNSGCPKKLLRNLELRRFMFKFAAKSAALFVE
jgi:hypothetical protein